MTSISTNALGRVFAVSSTVLTFACGGHLTLGEDHGVGGTHSSGKSGSSHTGGTLGSGGSSSGPTAGGGAQAENQTPPACGPEHSTGPDGLIAFDSDRADFNRDIYLINPDGSGLRRLTEEPSIDEEPSLSPDGKQLSFTSDRGGQPQIFLFDLITGLATPLTDRPEGADQSSFSHDGQLVAFHSGASVYIIRADGSDERLVATGLDSFNAYFWPHFSRDDRELLFDRNNEINATLLDGSGLRPIVTNSTITMKSPSVAPNGREIAYSTSCGDKHSIWTTSFSSSTSPCQGRRVTPESQYAAERPSWGPQNWLAYERIDKSMGVAQIALISRTGGSQPCILTPGAADDRNPSWLADAI